MCTTKTPKVSTTVAQAAEKKDPIYMRNKYLDGLGMGSETAGRSSLRINRGATLGRVPVSVMPGMGSTPLSSMRGPYMGAY